MEKAKYQGVLGINIGKNIDTPVERAVEDYVLCLRAVYAHADYITVNISSPNTPGLRTLQYGDELQALISRLKVEQRQLADQQGKYVPLAVKVAPDLTLAEIQGMAAIFCEHQIDAVIATNTTLDKSAVQGVRHSDEQGGLSGQPLTQKSTEVIAAFYQHLAEDIPIIGVGGIMTGEDAAAKLAAGAKLVQLYSGFIYHGPRLIKDCVRATSAA